MTLQELYDSGAYVYPCRRASWPAGLRVETWEHDPTRMLRMTMGAVNCAYCTNADDFVANDWERYV